MNARALNALAGVICRAQEQDRTPMGIAVRIEAAGMLQSPETAAELEKLRAERDAYCDRVDTLTAVAKGNKRHVQEMYTDLQKALARVDEVERKYIFDTAELKQRVAELEAAARPAILDLPPSRQTRRLLTDRGDQS